MSVKRILFVALVCTSACQTTTLPVANGPPTDIPQTVPFPIFPQVISGLTTEQSDRFNTIYAAKKAAIVSANTLEANSVWAECYARLGGGGYCCGQMRAVRAEAAVLLKNAYLESFSELLDEYGVLADSSLWAIIRQQADTIEHVGISEAQNRSCP